MSETKRTLILFCLATALTVALIIFPPTTAFSLIFWFCVLSGVLVIPALHGAEYLLKGWPGSLRRSPTINLLGYSAWVKLRALQSLGRAHAIQSFIHCL
jgi:hypothetical protein